MAKSSTFLFSDLSFSVERDLLAEIFTLDFKSLSVSKLSGFSPQAHPDIGAAPQFSILRA